MSRIDWFIQGGSTAAAPVPVYLEARWKPALRRVTKLKDALDDALRRWSTPAPVTLETAIAATLRRYGVNVTHARALADAGARWDHYFPEHFARCILGNWLFASRNPRLEVGWVDLHPYSVLGGFRKEPYRVTPTLSQALARQKTQSLAADVIAAGPNDTMVAPSTSAIEGIPLFWNGEGKNRTQLYRAAGVPLTTRLWVYPRPDGVSQLVLRRVAGMPLGLLSDPTGARQIMPFPELSAALLRRCGAQVQLYSRPSVRGCLIALHDLWKRYGLINGLRVLRSKSALRLAWLTSPLGDHYRDPSALFKI